MVLTDEYFELTVITFCFLAPSYIVEAVNYGVVEDWFTSDIHKQIWQKIAEGYRSGVHVDSVWIYRQFSIHGEVVNHLANNVNERISQILNPTEFSNALEELKENYQKRQVDQELMRARRKLHNEDSEEVVKNLVSRLSKVTANNRNSKVSLKEEIQRRISASVKISTGYRQLDHYWGGITPATFIVIGGFTANCKSLFTTNIAYNVSSKGHPVAIVSTQQSEVFMGMRLATMISGINFRPHQPMTEEEKRDYMEACDKISKMPLDLFQTSTLSDICTKLRQKYYKLVIVDYLQRITTGIPNVDSARYQRVGYVCEQLERLALENKTCVVGVSQLHRPNKNDSEPNINYYRDSGEIEEAATIACIIWYPYQNANDKMKKFHRRQGTENLLHFEIAKNNLYGFTDKIDFCLNKQNLKIAEDGVDRCNQL